MRASAHHIIAILHSISQLPQVIDWHFFSLFRNLQAALSTYFDFIASSNQNNGLQAMPSMRVVKELTIGLGESVTPNVRIFAKACCTYFTKNFAL